MAEKTTEKNVTDFDVTPTVDTEEASPTDEYKDIPLKQALAPGEDDEVVDPRLKNYPIPLVAKSVGLANDPT
jgi:hypothetical protein